LNQAICFYFPYYEDSGVPVLFYRMANAIALAYPDSKLSVIDFENGVMWRNLVDSPNIEKIKFEYNTFVSPPAESVLVMQTFVPYYWPKELIVDENQKLFFWNLHPHNLIPSLLPIPFLREIPYNNPRIYHFLSLFYKNLIERLRNYTNCLIENKGLSFMDKSNLDYTSKHLFLPIINRDFIPVPATSSTLKFNLNNEVILSGVIRLTWIGRLCDFKSYILVYTIKKLNEISLKFNNQKFEFNIVGDGPFEDYIRSEIKNCKSLSVIFHGAIPHNDIDNFIHTKTDIVMAMGTSALEGAKLGKPTILLDPVLKEINGDYIFRMLYDTKEFDLGHFITPDDFLQNNNSLYDILNNIITNYKIHSYKTYDYFENNHNMKNVKLLFLKKIMNSNLVYSMIDKKVFTKSPILKIYNQFRGLKS
jgi:hypothetical protein